MSKLFTIQLIVLCMLLVGCQDSNTRQLTNTITLTLDNGDKITGIPADSIYSQVQYIPLETNKESFIGEIDRVKIQNNLILAYNKSISSLFIFDISGKYLTKLQKKGRGNGEYLQIDDFNIKNDRLIILDGQRKQLLYYSLQEMRFINTLNLNDWYSHFELLDNQIVLYSNFSTSDKKYFNLVSIDTKQQQPTRYMLPFPESQNGTSYSTKYIFCSHNNAIYTSHPWNYSIYKVDTTDIQEVLTVDFQDYSMPESIRKGSTDDKDVYMSRFDFATRPVSDIGDLIITDKYYIFSFIHRCMTYTCRYNIDDKTHIHGVIGGTKSFPFYRQTYHGVYKNSIIGCINSPTIVDSKMKRPNTLKDIDEMSNPVIALYEIK
ncbi:MAG: 6-bladed beta-propeller [Marinifilaceae bacterium]